jgi:signal transduction histidine kinase
MVYNLVEDDLGSLWFGSASGVVRASKTALNEYAAGKSKYIFSTLFGKADGLMDLDVSSLGQPGALKAADGKLWFATTSPYLAIVDPAMAEDKSHPSVHIEDCEIDGRPRFCGSELKITPRDTEIQIRYSALGFYRPEQYRFKYKLDGLDSDWTYAGSRRTAYFSRPPSGSFLFRVAVANGDGVWSPEQGTLRFTIQPPFYATLAFRTALLGLIVLITAAAWSYRMREMRRAQAAQQAFARQLIASQEGERQRIAAELHDSLGQRLSLIKNLALVSLREMREADPLHGHIEEISSQASGANREVREIAYNLRPYQLDRIGLTKAIQSLAESIREACGIATLVHVDDIDDAFRKDLEINFYRIVQEALNNVVKHSQASEVTMVIERTKDFVNLTVRDNGRGGVPNIMDGNSSCRGFGVTGMIERGYLLGGKTVIHSVQGQGTTVTVEIALNSKRN